MGDLFEEPTNVGKVYLATDDGSWQELRGVKEFHIPWESEVDEGYEEFVQPPLNQTFHMEFSESSEGQSFFDRKSYWERIMEIFFGPDVTFPICTGVRIVELNTRSLELPRPIFSTI